MTEHYPYRTIDDLPLRFPIFPLPGAILLPRGRLPLNIFEPRYLTMVDDALRSDRVIGMVQPQAAAHDEGSKSSLYRIGCVGRITSFSETGDGRYLITLSGVCRFSIANELDCVTPYRQITSDFASFSTDLHAEENTDDVNREKLLAALKTYMHIHNMETDWESVQQAPPESLVNSLSMICPFEPTEKQALVEAATVSDRAEILTALIEMATAQNAGGSDPSLQ